MKHVFYVALATMGWVHPTPAQSPLIVDVEGPKQVNPGETIRISWRLQNLPGPVTHTNVHWRTTADGREAFERTPVPVDGTYTSSFTAPLLSPQVFYRIHATVDGQNHFSVTAQVAIALGDKPPLITVTEVPTGRPNPQFEVAWRIGALPAEAVISHTNVHWGTEPDRFPNTERFSSLDPSTGEYRSSVRGHGTARVLFCHSRSDPSEQPL